MYDDDAHANVTVESVSPAEYATRTVTVDFLYLDREECTRCRDTDDVLADAIDQVAGLLSQLSVEVDVRTVHVESEVAARQVGLAVSPTVRVNGRDVQPDYAVSTCESCGDLCDCGEDVDCRLWHYRGQDHETPPVELFVEALLRGAVVGGQKPTAEPTRDEPLPANLQRFFGSDRDENQSDGCC